MKAIPLSLLLALSASAWAAAPTSSPESARPTATEPFYATTKLMTPPGVDAQVGGLLALKSGRIAVAFHHGEVGIYNPKDQSWQIFAEGLHEPLGLAEEADGSLLVMQRPELTRLKDLNGDGIADQYQTVWDDFGMTGNYHEFAFGPALSPTGKLYLGLNLASSGDTIFKEVRGEFTPLGLPREEFYGNWKTNAVKAGRMYSRVPWRGWIMELDPKTGITTPFASGLRSPDGLGFTPTGELIVSDNQGDWRGTSELHVVERDGFYGHPASLVWRQDWHEGDPLKIPVDQLTSLRTPAAIWFPHNIYANSPTQPVLIPKTPAWGPFGGQILIGEMNNPKLIRLLLEKTDGVWQGACVNLAEIKALKLGIHRLAFSDDTLYIGRTHLSWAGAEGVATLKPTGKVPFDPLDIHVTPTGFKITFTEALSANASDPTLWNIEHYTYAYHAVYGSPQLEKAPDQPKSITLSKDRKTAEVTFSELKANFIYDFNLTKLKSATESTPLNPHLAYTLRKIPGRPNR